ncbi:MAG: PaaI family thioesterase [Chloroflexota bacterium]|nr:MAG: PaaI family thioesterase [Chloroflexota bacterium]
MEKQAIMDFFKQQLGQDTSRYSLPPPVFELMKGEFIEIDLAAGWIRCRFENLDIFQNPFGVMQGGMVATAVDNTLGPLSMLVAPANVTRRLEMKYSLPVTEDVEHLYVEARLKARHGRKLYFNAEVRDQRGRLLARGQAFHWIIAEEEQKPG